MKNLFSLFLLIISCLYLSIAFSFSMFSNNIPGSGFFPQLIGITLVLLTGSDLIKNYRENRNDSVSRTYLAEMINLVILCAIYIFIFSIIGAFLSTVLFTTVVLLLFNKGKLKQNILIGVIVPVVIFVLFEYLLNTGLPLGIFENII